MPDRSLTEPFFKAYGPQRKGRNTSRQTELHSFRFASYAVRVGARQPVGGQFHAAQEEGLGEETCWAGLSHSKLFGDVPMFGCLFAHPCEFLEGPDGSQTGLERRSSRLPRTRSPFVSYCQLVHHLRTKVWGVLLRRTWQFAHEDLSQVCLEKKQTNVDPRSTNPCVSNGGAAGLSGESDPLSECSTPILTNRVY